METPRHVARVGHLTTNVLIRNSSFAYGFERKARSVAVVYSNHREKLWIFRSRVSGRERLFFFFFSFRCAAQQQATTQTDRSEVLLFAALATGETRYARDLFFCFRACANRSRKETRSLNGFVRFSLFLVFYLRACFFPLEQTDWIYLFIEVDG